jgi:diaminohydroxyphosphoribosylaminopyrimidine deaminase / 5-amino-6-(5-phosphoribosylamino)uracil reductase
MAAVAELAAMQRAIALSAAGLGTTSPNPPVGCVLLGVDGGLIADGYHERKGEPHAEAQAVAAAGDLAAGATAVVTLEPCNHHGRTPPCRQVLIDAGVRRVVIALMDPTSRGDGGAAELRRAGIEVETGVLADEARIVLGGWLDALKSRRPFITWPYIVTQHAVVGLAARSAAEQELRLNYDAVLGADGAVREAVPYSHGKGILTLNDPETGAGAVAVAARLYDEGVRRLLLAGALDVAGPFLDAGLVDRVLVYLPSAAPSRPGSDGLPWPLLPPGFTVTEADRIEGFVRVEGRPER